MDFEALKWRKFSVLDKGWVCLVDKMGDDAAIVQAARTSYGGKKREGSDDEILLRYLMRQRHDSPFESCMIKLQVHLPIAVERQWVRHRVAGLSEVSYRYTEVKDEVHIPDVVRGQSKNNKQGGDEPLEEASQEYLKARMGVSCDTAFMGYRECLDKGMSREDARLQLPLSTYTEKVWWCNLRGLLHFLDLRMDSHAQWQIREYANVIGEQIVKPLFPATWQAFLDYRLNSMQLTALDVEMIAKLGGEWVHEAEFRRLCPVQWQADRCRERDECLEKLVRLGLVVKQESK